METTAYLIAREANPVVLQIHGRASFSNCTAARSFFLQRQSCGCKEFVIDLKDCRGIDSTFLGILAGLANNVSAIGGKVLLTRPSEAILGTIKNLGLDRLLQIAPSLEDILSAPAASASGNTSTGQTTTLKPETVTEMEQAKILLQAHENLVQANPDTAPIFMDVIEFLKTQINRSNLG